MTPWQPRICWEMQLQPTGPPTAPNADASLRGIVTINGVPHWVEGIAVVTDTETGLQTPAVPNPYANTVLSQIVEIVGGAGETVEHDGRQYVLCITPCPL